MRKSREIGRDDSWEGAVVDLSRGLLDGSNMYHFAEVRVGEGEPFKVRISRRLWKTLAVGDRLVKEPGSDPAKG
ncbi:hypothetical protein ACFV3R_22830 [Streptomyces sp. NPDC059740]|uniref:DUF7489 domain-containing protein n=1 Tax=Streptomyces sp. NPDC059740 TaxID=3346926 RepID=UPI003650542D